jgi:type IV pilus assembly protein PilB
MNTTTTNVSSPRIELSDFIENEPPEVIEAKQLAKRYRLPYIDLLPPDQTSPIDYEELAKIPVDTMLKNHFVPLRREGRNLHAAMADPTNLEVLDELENALDVRIVPYVATQGAIDVILKRGDATQRVLQEAAQGFKISLVKET